MRPYFFQLLAISILSIFNNLEAKANRDKGYLTISKEANSNNELFDNFKRHPASLQFTEDASNETGQKYLIHIKKCYPDLLPHFDKFRENDLFGNPVTFDYGTDGALSSSTLKYIKTAGDLQKKFGDLRNFNIIELGGSLGGQCKILADSLGFSSYTIIETPECCEVTRKFLDLLKLSHVRVVSFQEAEQLPPCDLVISHGFYSTTEKKSKQTLLRNIILNAAKGYIVLHETFAADELVADLYHKGKKGSIEREYPLLESKNTLLVWRDKAPEICFKTPPDLDNSDNRQTLPAVSYSFSGGRFGDNLVAYLHAKWISLKYSLPFIYRPFPFSDQLKLDETTQRYGVFAFNAEKDIKGEGDFLKPEGSTLYIVPYFPDCLLEYEMHEFVKQLPYFEVDWENTQFKREIRKLLSPKNPLNTLPLPKDKITVCVHIRRGGNVDHPNIRFSVPLKFPPDNYYILQIKRIAEFFPKEKLYVFLMTDDLNPAALAQNYATALRNYNIQFDYRYMGNSPHHNIMEDFFSMGKFDCLIRAQSNFSLMGGLLGDYRILITPTHAYIKGDDIIVDNIELIFNPLIL